jgi:hypothetical protein
MKSPFGPYSPAWRAALERMRSQGELAPRRDRDREAKERWDGEGGSLPPPRGQP